MSNDVDPAPKCEKCLVPYSSDRLMHFMISCKHHVCQVCYWKDSKRNRSQLKERLKFSKALEHFEKTAFKNDSYCMISRSQTICAKCEKKSDSCYIPIVEDLVAAVENQRSTISQLKRKIEEDNKEECDEKKQSLEDRLKCQNCGEPHFEKKLHLCQTCDGSRFECPKNFLKLAICSTCALRHHSRLGHTTVDFFPCVRDSMFNRQVDEVNAALRGLNDVCETRKAAVEKFQETRDAVRIKQIYNLTNDTRNATSTSAFNNNMEKLLKFIEQSKNIYVDETSDLRKKTSLLETALVELDVDSK